jgi:hypothetical protein
LLVEEGVGGGVLALSEDASILAAALFGALPGGQLELAGNRFEWRLGRVDCGCVGGWACGKEGEVAIAVAKLDVDRLFVDWCIRRITFPTPLHCFPLL